MLRTSGWHKGSRMRCWGKLVRRPSGGNPWENFRMHGFSRLLQKGKIHPNGCALSWQRHKTSLLHLDGFQNSLKIALCSLVLSSWPPLARLWSWRATWRQWGPLLSHDIKRCPQLVGFAGLSSGTTNPGRTRKLDNPLKGIRYPIPRNLDNPLKGIQDLVQNGTQSQWPIGLTVPT